MNKKMITVISLFLSIAAIAFVAYNAVTKLRDIDYSLFDIEEDIDEDDE
jgi:hypothetical protein